MYFHPSGPDPELRCPARGLEWIPDWKRKAAVKYNAKRPKEKPDPDFINAPPPVRSGTTKPTAKQACLPLGPLDDSDTSSTDSSVDNYQDAKQDLDDDDSSDDEAQSLGYRPVSKMAIAHSDGNSCAADSNGLYRY